MSSTDDLRSALERHADGVSDHDVHLRPVAVRSRIRAVRRRRRAVAGGLAGLAVVAATAVTFSLGSDRSAPVADRTLAGHLAPVTMTSLGYTYEFAQARQGDGRASLDLPRTEAPRLLSWATEGSDDRVTLRTEGEAPRLLEADDFGDFTFVAPRQGGTYTLTGKGQVALAAYVLTDAAAPGDTNDQITFRDEVAGQRLVADAIGDPGDADLDLSLELGGGPLPVSYLCSGGPRGSWVHVALDGGQAVSGEGCDDPLFDPAGSGGFTTYPDAAEARDLHVRIWVSDGEHGPVVVDPDLRLGVAAYAPAPTVTRLAGAPLARTVEYDGHVWQLRGVEAGDPGERAVDTAGIAGKETLVGLHFRRAGRGTVTTVLEGRPGNTEFGTGAGGGVLGVIPASGGSAGLRAHGDLGSGVELGLASYVRVD
jgi:hypothetical protein